MNVDRLKIELNNLLNRLGDNYNATVIIRNTKDDKDCKLITTESKLIEAIDTTLYLIKRDKITKSKLS